MANDICIADITRQTSANHGSLGQRVDDRALCVLAARREGGARVLADLVEAGQLAGTLAVLRALGTGRLGN